MALFFFNDLLPFITPTLWDIYIVKYILLSWPNAQQGPMSLRAMNTNRHSWLLDIVLQAKGAKLNKTVLIKKKQLSLSSRSRRPG